MTMRPKLFQENIYMQDDIFFLRSEICGTNPLVEMVNAITTNDDGDRKLEYYCRDCVTLEKGEQRWT